MKLFYPELHKTLVPHYRWYPVLIVLEIVALLASYPFDFFGLGIDLVILLIAGQAAAGVTLCVQSLARIESRILEKESTDGT